MKKTINSKKALLLLALIPFALTGQEASRFFMDSTPQLDGVIFNCNKNEIANLEKEMPLYFKEIGINQNLVQTIKTESSIGYVLKTPVTDTNTLDLGARPEFQITDEVVLLPTKTSEMRKVTTVSKKEIIYALFQHGRLTEFNKTGCNTLAFRDHVGIRQNIAAWTERVGFGFPDGKASEWNPEYWDESPMPKKGPLHKAINDLFINHRKYSMGCYTASKAVMSQGILDYYSRVRPDAVKLAAAENAMLVDRAPLSNIEPGMTWDFVKSMTDEDLKTPGKILTFKKGVASKNFIPGDWSYIKNTDEKSSNMSGYEGSNAVYLGRNNFDDYYGEMKNKHYTFEEKMDEVYQWRNEVYTASEESQKKRKNITKEQFNNLLETPYYGGILVDHRITPKIF